MGEPRTNQESPGADDKLAPELQDKVKEWIDGHWTGSRKCPICGTSNWNLNPYLASILTVTPERTLNFGRHYPTIVVLCDNCSFVRLFNSKKMGILPISTDCNGEEGETEDE